MIYVIGFLAQVFFSARILLQWILSERAKKVISPAIFWQLSLYLEFGQKASMEEITVYHPDVIAFDPGGGNFIHA